VSVDRALFRVERARSRAAALVRSALGLKRTVYVNERHAEYRRYWEEGARLLGGGLVPVTDEVWEVRRGNRAVRLSNYFVPLDDPVTLRLAGDKAYCYRLAVDAGVPVTPHAIVNAGEVDAARRFVGEHEPPFVVKPARGSSSGLGISTLLESWGEVRRALALASLYDRRAIVERMIPGESCRLLFLGGACIHAVRRRGVRVTGDGRRSVAELLRAGGHSALTGDRNTRFTLRAQGRGIDNVPAPGEELLARGLPPEESTARELRTVYTETITERCSPLLLSELARIVHALGSRFAGVDIVATDVSRPLSETGGMFLEINTTPGIHHHYITQEDFAPNPVARQVLTHLLDGARPEER
jgi:cyanophycin synthetase